jgi:hypothetical protein
MTENFDEPFASWESRFMGTESNLANYYVVQGGTVDDRGNNPDGLWLDDGDGLYGSDIVNIVFNSSFAHSLTSMSFLLSIFFSGATLEFFDASGVTLSTQTVVGDAQFTPVLSYGVSSTTGIGGFRLIDSAYAQLEGNTSIDAISVTIGTVIPSVPVPAPIFLLGAAIAGLGVLRRKKLSALA